MVFIKVMEEVHVFLLLACFFNGAFGLASTATAALADALRREGYLFDTGAMTRSSIETRTKTKFNLVIYFIHCAYALLLVDQFRTTIGLRA